MPSIRLTGNGGIAASATNLTGLNATTGITVAAWVRPDVESALITGDILSQASTANNLRDGYAMSFGSANNLNFYVLGSAGSTTSSLSAGRTRIIHNQWVHYAVTFDNASDVVLFYRNGMLVDRQTNTRDMTANASCTTRVAGSSITGGLSGSIFDAQFLPNVVVPPSDIRLLMDPTVKYPGVKGRYCARNYSGSSTNVRDESDNGNDLSTINATLSGTEPPLRPTLA